MIEKITDNVSRIYFPDVHTCNCYFIHDKRIVIDCGVISVGDALKSLLPIAPEDVAMVLLTHLHYDHIGCFDVFYSSPFYASESAVSSLESNPGITVYDTETIQHIYQKKFKPKPFEIETLKDLGFEIFETPGHAEGSVCFLFDDNGTKILFPGDLFFDKDMNVVGRTDLPVSDKKKMEISLRRMSALSYDILCPGHGKITRL